MWLQCVRMDVSNKVLLANCNPGVYWGGGGGGDCV